MINRDDIEDIKYRVYQAYNFIDDTQSKETHTLWLLEDICMYLHINILSKHQLCLDTYLEKLNADDIDHFITQCVINRTFGNEFS